MAVESRPKDANCDKELIDSYFNYQPIWKFQKLYFTPSWLRNTWTEKSCEQCRIVAGGHKHEVCPAARFSPLVCKLAVSNGFWETALLHGCSLTARPTLASLSGLPSQICPDVPSLSGAAPGGCAIARMAYPLPVSGSKPTEPCKSLPLQTRWPQMGLTYRRPWTLGHQSGDISFCWW